MSTTENKDTINIQKVKDALWASLQKHLDKIFDAERTLNKSLNFTDIFPFNPSLVDAEKLNEFLVQRNSMKDLFIDETEQLDNLIKTIRQKNYKEEDKKYLMLLILGYMDIAHSIFSGLEIYKPAKYQEDEEYIKSSSKFDRLMKFARLNIKGIMPRK